MSWEIQEGNSLDVLKEMEDKSVHCCVTSPPYFGLRDYENEGQLGMEDTPEEFVANLLEIFREVKRVLRDDGTFWLNLGDSYSGSGKGMNSDGTFAKEGKQATHKGTVTGKLKKSKVPNGMKPKDLMGIPWMVAFALRADGWYLRQDIIWSKPNAMPEPVRDRCTKSHEYIFLLSKSKKYYYDTEAIKEKTKNVVTSPDVIFKRNKRSVWTVTTRSFKGAHFATFPEELIEPCILAGCPEKVCEKCGAPHERKTERTRLNRTELPEGDPRRRPNTYKGAYGEINGKSDAGYTTVKTLGFEPTCECNTGEARGVVIDPFSGAGTTGVVSTINGRSYKGIELNSDYVEMSRERLDKATKQGDLFTGMSMEK